MCVLACMDVELHIQYSMSPLASHRTYIRTLAWSCRKEANSVFHRMARALKEFLTGSVVTSRGPMMKEGGRELTCNRTVEAVILNHLHTVSSGVAAK